MSVDERLEQLEDSMTLTIATVQEVARRMGVDLPPPPGARAPEHPLGL